jgi:hypothetical protein
MLLSRHSLPWPYELQPPAWESDVGLAPCHLRPPVSVSPRTRLKHLTTIVYIAISTFGPAPAWIRSDKQRQIYLLPTRNFIMGGIDRLKPVLTGLKNEDERATQALLCQSRGIKARLPCSSCCADRGPFNACVEMHAVELERCANCIILSGHCDKDELETGSNAEATLHTQSS